jgi:chemotaxis protein methyltransferase CheR
MSIGPDDFGFIRDLVRRRSAIILDDGKEYLVTSRLSALARDEGFGSLDQLVHDLRTRPSNGLHRKVVQAMTTNETMFFRDVHPFDAIRDKILPELIERKADQRRLSIWCAASSTGQEPYSIAMMIRDQVPALTGWDVRIIATDFSSDVLERARAGVYSQLEVNRGLPVRYLVRHFTKLDLQWQISDEVRSMVDYRELNLIDPWVGIASMDLVLLRNVLIYFDVETKKSILGKVRSVMQPHGYLFLGGAETTLNLDDGFERVESGRAVAYRHRR